MGKFLGIEKSAIGNNKNLVTSLNDEGKISIAQQMIVHDGTRDIEIFLKNSIIVDLGGLKEIKKIIDNTIEKVENNNILKKY